jgi:RNA polymerase sigma factor (TIGR02999 family)
LTARTALDRSVFFPAAAEAMRRILVDHARKKKAAKRGGAGRRFELRDDDRIATDDPELVLMIDEAMEKLNAEDPAAESIARLRLFAGLEVAEAADTLGVSRATAFRDWAYARAYLTDALS